MTSAGYLDQFCPTDPSHGRALAMDTGMCCPHAGHTPPDPELHTKCFWTFDEWEAAKSGQAPKSPTPEVDTTKPRAISVRKPRAGSNRRRSR